MLGLAKGRQAVRRLQAVIRHLCITTQASGAVNRALLAPGPTSFGGEQHSLLVGSPTLDLNHLEH